MTGSAGFSVNMCRISDSLRSSCYWNAGIQGYGKLVHLENQRGGKPVIISKFRKRQLAVSAFEFSIISSGQSPAAPEGEQHEAARNTCTHSYG
jgi:hypothetical protein